MRGADHLLPDGAQSDYLARRGEIETYFDRTAAQAWARLTSDAPLGRIRTSVRAGRDHMRATLLSWLPDDLEGRRLLDAGCGTGALSIEAARRGAQVLAIDLSPTLVSLAAERVPPELSQRVRFVSGDMLDQRLGAFDHVVLMDSLIHYRHEDAVRALERLAQRTTGSMLFTHVPSNPMLATMRAVGRLFPRGDRAPDVEPVADALLRRRVMQADALRGWQFGRDERVSSGFYKSHAQELIAP